MNTHKVCKKCLQNKELSCFGKHRGKKGNKDGLQPWCRECKNSKAREIKKKLRSSSPKFVLDRRMSKNISRCLGSAKAGRSWKNLVGYYPEELVSHLEKQFRPGMHWENYGTVWHIDHIIPKKYFQYIDADENFRECWSLKNLQPLFAEENLKKNASLPQKTLDY